MYRYRRMFPILLLLFWCLSKVQGEAAYEDIPNVSISADGNAFTTHAKDTDIEWYESETEIYTGVTGDLREPGEGEHFYSKVCHGRVPVEKWVVNWKEAGCAHAAYPEGNFVYGESFGREKCLEKYYSGWISYCADCKEPIISNYVYMSEDTAKNFTYMDLSMAYFYKCPFCDNLEQAVVYNKHFCKDISVNRYYVRYHANFGKGYMEKSVHMVNDATTYEGQEVTPQKTLNLNTYSREGYKFAGWNTAPDGSGESYTDGADIYNLSMEQDASVILYAQWEKCQSVLEVDPAGGSYEKKTSITQIMGNYGTKYEIDITKLVPPQGYIVHFDTRGGENIPEQIGQKEFADWKCLLPFQGSLIENTYTYWGADGNADRVVAVYKDVPISLPSAQREGYSFGGWYADEACTQPIGDCGDFFIPTKEITLYAGWVELLLLAENNTVANQGKGAVDLYWSQPDDLEKIYQIYQKGQDTDWIQVGEEQEIPQDYQVEKTILFSGKDGSYTVPYAGFYTLTLTGAQGGNDKVYQGGKGGLAEVVVYLKKGEKLSYIIGGQNGYCEGGRGNTYANGGGYSKVSSDRLGTLLIAGGGGGATEYGAGGAGGSNGHVVVAAAGENGEAGGGGGYQGGATGLVEKHHHTGECNHVHIGDASCYGGCYTKKTSCGSRDISKEEAWRTFYYGNVADDGSQKMCERCQSDSCPGHLDIYYLYTCKRCGTSSYHYTVKCTAITAYETDCGLSEGYSCGMEEGQILYAEPAYGGSSYVNTAICVDYMCESGVQNGNGELHIVSKQLGGFEEKKLLGVAAMDLVAPEVIEKADIEKTAITEEEIRVAFERPMDYGTDYYHMVESYSMKTGERICTSNITKNTLVSGIIGYYYVVDNFDDTSVGTMHSFYAEKGEQPFLVAKLGANEQYLHVAAVDKAGNIGDTCHILLSEQDVVYWPLITEKLLIEDGQQVYPATTADTYYVKADNSTPFLITLEGLLCGTARKEYQIDNGCFQIQNLTNTLQTGAMTIAVPKHENITLGTFTYPMERLSKKIEGVIGIQDAMYTIAQRFNMCKSVKIKQKFWIPQNCDGQQFLIMPRVAARGEEEIIWSLEENDVGNSICLIADGKGPEITGLEKIEGLKNSELEEEDVQIDLGAIDVGSGLAKFYVEIHNLENGMIERYQDENLGGKISVIISRDNALFQGRFVVCVYAEDCVGNETSMQDSVRNIGLNAYVERILEPHTPVFKKGESGVLHVETFGYIERVEVFFPESFTKTDASLNRVFAYENPVYLQKEEISFMIPFTVSEGDMTIKVRAYKSGTELEAEPHFLTITVKGSILDELRTRLR